MRRWRRRCARRSSTALASRPYECLNYEGCNGCLYSLNCEGCNGFLHCASNGCRGAGVREEVRRLRRADPTNASIMKGATAFCTARVTGVEEQVCEKKFDGFGEQMRRARSTSSTPNPKSVRSMTPRPSTRQSSTSQTLNPCTLNPKS